MHLESLASCRSPAQLSELAGRQAESLGFDLWSYVAVVLHGSQPSAVWPLHNVPADLWATYAAQTVIERSRRSVVPRAWTIDDVPALSAGDDDGAPLDQLQQAMRRHGVTGGLCLPIHDVTGLVATLTLASREPVSTESLRRATAPALLFSKYLHHACRPHVLDALSKPAPSCAALSPREIECLTWASKGKTSWEIGRVLGISEHTAVFHLRNASTKLGTANRQQAVAKWIQLGVSRA